jgi:hypothetical protein
LFDRLHVNNEGNFSDHLWTQFQERIKSVSRQAQAKIDEQYIFLSLRIADIVTLLLE